MYTPPLSPRAAAPAGEVGAGHGAGSAAPPGRAVLGVRPRGVGVSRVRGEDLVARSGLKASRGLWAPAPGSRACSNPDPVRMRIATRDAIIFEQFDSGARAGILRYERGGTIGTV